MSLAHAEVQNITDYTERFVSDCSDNEVMSMHTEIKKRIEQEIEEQSRQPGKSMEPVEEADMGVEVGCVEALQQLCQTKAEITQLVINLTECTLSTEIAGSPMVNQQISVALSTKQSSCKTTRHKCAITAQLKCLFNGSVIKCEVKRSKKTGGYLIKYTLTVRGCHELSVLLDEEQVAGSPLSMLVSVHPTQLGKPVKVWTGLKKPNGIAINSTGEILVSEVGGDIVKLCKDGKKQVLVKKDVHGLTDVCDDIATDSEDNIYCVSLLTNRIMRCSKNGGDIHVKEVVQTQSGHTGVTVIGNEVITCEMKTGDIAVYDRNLYFKRWIKNKGFFRATCPGVNGNIYATSSDNMIHVISKDGVVLRSFGCDSNGVKMLNGPGGTCVSGQFVYVTNLYGHNVSVFTTAGDFITSFRGHGSRDGELREPVGVYTDLDRFVYVVDENGRVQCF